MEEQSREQSVAAKAQGGPLGALREWSLKPTGMERSQGEEGAQREDRAEAVQALKEARRKLPPPERRG